MTKQLDPTPQIGIAGFDGCLAQLQVEDDSTITEDDFIVMAHGSAAAAGETSGASAAAKTAISTRSAVHRFQIAFFIAAPDYLRKAIMETPICFLFVTNL